jgi:hypothetical protein
MGGWGSGRQAYKYELTVEDCLSIETGSIFRGKCNMPGSFRSGTLYWKIDGQKIGLVKYTVCLKLNSPYVTLQHNGNKTKISYKVSLTYTHPNYGGFRYWFLCPACGIRVRKLYFHISKPLFLCRHCQNLTYTSCRMSHELDTIINKFAKETGRSWDETKKAILQIRKNYGVSKKPMNLVGES